MILICVTLNEGWFWFWFLNEGQGQYNEHVMHPHAWGSHHAKFDDDDLNSFGGIACEGHRHTDTVSVLYIKKSPVLFLAWGWPALWWPCPYDTPPWSAGPAAGRSHLHSTTWQTVRVHHCLTWDHNMSNNLWLCTSLSHLNITNIKQPMYIALTCRSHVKQPVYIILSPEHRNISNNLCTSPSHLNIATCQLVYVAISHAQHMSNDSCLSPSHLPSFEKAKLACEQHPNCWRQGYTCKPLTLVTREEYPQSGLVQLSQHGVHVLAVLSETWQFGGVITFWATANNNAVIHL